MDGNGADREWMSVIGALEDQLASGAVRAGSRIPSERSLASHLHVKRASVRAGLRVLEVRLVSARSRVPFGSAGIVVASPSGGLGALMRLQVAAQGFRTTDMVRTRLLLESAVVKDLAERNDVVDLSLANELLDAMDEPEISEADFLVLDARFHLALAEAAGNEIVTAVMAGMRHSLEAGEFVGARNLVEWSFTLDRLRSEHRGIIAAVIEGDGTRAARLMQQHVSGYYAETKLMPEAS